MAGDESQCPCCGKPGKKRYTGLRDRLFGCPGSWPIDQCSDPNCGHGWMSGTLPDGGVAVFYERYYTHERGPRSQYGSGTKLLGLLSRLLRWFDGLVGLQKRRKAHELMFLQDRKPGRLLDVGCGDGTQLRAFHAVGWDVTGQDIDPSINHEELRSQGIKVFCGELSTLAADLRSYDAVILNHVLEHDTNPAELLRFCRKLLAPGGKLVAVCPNFESFCHRRFGANWRGLEPPRHLHHFSTRSLRSIANQAELGDVSVDTSPHHAEQFALGSYQVARVGDDESSESVPIRLRLQAVALQYLALGSWLFDRNSGEELILQYTKPRQG